MFSLSYTLINAPESFHEIFMESIIDLAGFYQGGLVTIIRDVPGYGVYF